ncbi:hypothetical protein D7B24_002336 [Verticillium nonalfalfae]|uniref:FAD-binding PCMH-type domain-containing protein n=1 Tax=Verticillium nonalfalfae TaxID=1051616 RepID=A0A3M9XXY5_9PEZI|nr:uncharacterized protein D7B24_002336 [Verticillium nonalfalfae]RNJ53113.1 hypothetical protein D7B24_002336 [Verticillium nonalfalfae]
MKLITAAAILAWASERTAAATAGVQSPQSACCTALAKDKNLVGKVINPTNALYSQRLDTYYSANAAQEPWCMVLPLGTADVAATVKILTKNQCPFGMRSGAHSAWAGSNGIKDGVTIDFAYMNTTTYNKAAGTASIQPGSDWERVFDALDPFGVSAVGGRASVVGVGGFTTGGGYSFHSNSEGFACDAVANFEVVLADGRVVNANAKQNADLWKSLKGGSGNFGLVTRIDQYVVDSNLMWGGLSTYDTSKRDELFNAYLNFGNNMDKDLASQNIIAMIYNSAGFIFVSVLSNIDAIDNAPAFNEYRVIQNTSSTARIAPVAQLVPDFTGPTPLGLYASWMNGMTKHELHVMEFIQQAHQEYVGKMKAAAPSSNFEVLLQFQPVTQSIVNHSVRKGGNVLGLETIVKDGPVLMWLIALTVDTPANQEKILPICLQLRDAINAYADKTGSQKNWEFLNYSFSDQDPISRYGAKNIAHVKAASKKYDPKGVFQKLRRTGFKLPA